MRQQGYGIRKGGMAFRTGKRLRHQRLWLEDRQYGFWELHKLAIVSGLETVFVSLRLSGIGIHNRTRCDLRTSKHFEL